MGLTYIRTDKNGTKYYADYTCDRCGGVGGSDVWNYTGWTCYKCNGSGKQINPRIVKEYTEEYSLKLEERRKKREEKKRLQRIKEFEENFDELVRKQGFNENGEIYVVIGNTFDIKDELKKAGARYRNDIHWYFLEKQDTYETITLHYSECLNVYHEYGTMSWKSTEEIQALINRKLPRDNVSEYVGKIGERINIIATIVKVYDYEVLNYVGYGTDMKSIVTFEDENGNCLVWKKSSFFEFQEGTKVNLVGTIKEHSEYKGIKQTLLQRCKVKEIE